MPDDLVTTEGVDEGSAGSSNEGDAGPDPDAARDADLVGEAPHGAAQSEASPAPPLPPHESEPGPGQQLAEGEG